MTQRLEVRDLTVTYPGPPSVRAVHDLTLAVSAGECLGVLGESGSGKSTLARTLLGLSDDASVTGSIRLGDLELVGADEQRWQQVRWDRLALVFQSTSSLNPVLRIGQQIAEAIEAHATDGRRAVGAKVERLLARVGLPPEMADRYPSELSGGQRRLCLLATALACEAEVLVLDEPTAGLDPFRRDQVLTLLRSLCDDGVAMLLFTHDVEALGVVADRVGVMYRGWLAELGPSDAVLHGPRNPYTWGLLNAHPTLGTIKDLRGIRGTPPDPTVLAVGCPFVERCTQAIAECHDGTPPLVPPVPEAPDHLVACVRGGLVPVLEATGLHKRYRVRRGPLRHEEVAAVDGVDLTVHEGEVVGVVGPTGAGKSTLGQLLVRLIEPDGGAVRIEGNEVFSADRDQLRAVRRRAQMLFQDPFEALSPRQTVRQVVREPLDVQGIGSDEERDRHVERMLAEVRLPATSAFWQRHTHELSGGQLQRVALARALILDPKLLIADEAVAMLDPSEQTKLVQLLKHLQVERGMAMVFVSHELALVLRVADRVVVMDQGRVVEVATSTELLQRPTHPTTRRLLAAGGAAVAAPGEPTAIPRGLAAPAGSLAADHTADGAGPLRHEPSAPIRGPR
ncbi:MAG: ABC transporter ATP-binding protein [Nitriliruptoraceae bacterium]